MTSRLKAIPNEPRKCVKCGAYEGQLILKRTTHDGKKVFIKTKIQKHHWHGYIGTNVFDTADYCKSCDAKAHILARKKGICKLTSEQINILRAKQRIKQTPHKIPYHKLPKILPNNRVIKSFCLRLDEVIIVDRITYNTETDSISFRWFKIKP